MFKTLLHSSVNSPPSKAPKFQDLLEGVVETANGLLEALEQSDHLFFEDEKNTFNPNLIFLIGFMGSGKSFIGKKLADKMQMPFCDMDEWIERSEKRSIKDIFAREGETYFRALEKKYLRTFGQVQELIIATGGGTPCFFNNMDYMNKKGLTIYLKTNPELLAERLLTEKDHRPLVANLNQTELLDFIKKKLKERSSYYDQAAISVEINQNGEAMIEEIARYARM